MPYHNPTFEHNYSTGEADRYHYNHISDDSTSTGSGHYENSFSKEFNELKENHKQLESYLNKEIERRCVIEFEKEKLEKQVDGFKQRIEDLEKQVKELEVIDSRFDILDIRE